MLHTSRLIRKIVAASLLSLFCIGGIDNCQPQTDRQSHDSVFSDEGLLKADASALKTTLVTSYLDVPIQPDQNILWCGTFQLAWNEASKLAGGALKFQPPIPAMADALNQKSFDAGDLDDASYVALAGYVKDGIKDRIATTLRDHFHGQAHPSLPMDGAARPQDIVAYSYLFKNLQFPTVYERGDSPAQFSHAPVACFGMGPYYKPGRDKMAAQTLIHDYNSPDDFVIELQTQSAGDRLILAKIPPEKTLAQTVAAVYRRAEAHPTPALPQDVLVIPKSNFDITRSYTELANLRLIPTAPGMAGDLQITSALQNTRFQMDEQGVRLHSESTMTFGCSAASQPRPVHVMIFDQPFLLLLARKDAKHPYFALWISNPELLVAAP